MALGRRTTSSLLIARSDAARILRVHEEAIRFWCSEGVLTSGSREGAYSQMVTMDSVLALISPVPSRCSQS